MIDDDDDDDSFVPDNDKPYYDFNQQEADKLQQ